MIKTILRTHELGKADKIKYIKIGSKDKAKDKQWPSSNDVKLLGRYELYREKASQRVCFIVKNGHLKNSLALNVTDVTAGLSL